MYETKKGNTWKLNYSRDFYRPSYSELNTFKYYTSAFGYQIGNPTLKPSVYHSVSLSTTYKDFNFNSSFDLGVNESSNVTSFDNATQTQRTTSANMLDSRSLRMTITYFKMLKKRFSVDVFFLGSYSDIRVKNVVASQHLKNWVFLTDVKMNFMLDKRSSWIFMVNMSYWSPFYQQFTKKTEYPYMNFSLTKNMLNKRLTFKLSMTDPFRIMRSKSMLRSNSTEVKEDLYYDMQSIYFSAKFKFGNKRLQVNEKRAGSTGEAGRVK